MLNNPGDEVLYEMFTKKGMMDWLQPIEDYLFCKTVSVPYNPGDFKHNGGFVAVVNKYWKDKKIVDPMLGAKRTKKARFNDFVDEKFKKVINDGTYKPYEGMLDLLKRMAMELDPENPTCIIKLIYFYWERCHESHVCFFCHVNNNKKKTTKLCFKPKSPVGADTICKWVRNSVKIADFKDWEKYTPHDNQHQCCTILASDLAKLVQGALSSGLHKQSMWINKKKRTSHKELKKENKKQRTNLQDAEAKFAKFTVDLKESNNINKTLTNDEVDRLDQNGKKLEIEQKNLEQRIEEKMNLERLEEQKDLKHLH
eukprot:jgi/Psemu1/57757/gm1.57757_g